MASNRQDLLSHPGPLEASQWPLPKQQSMFSFRPGPIPHVPQTVGTPFDGATGPAETGAFPPDTMGAVGPTQFFVFLNGRLRTFNKTSGVADGVLDTSSNVFFAAVLTPAGAGTVTITSNPQVRYDRLSARWFLVMLDGTFNTSTGATMQPNRVLIAVSDAASNGNVTGSTVWTLYQFQADASLFAKDASLGIDR